MSGCALNELKKCFNDDFKHDAFKKKCKKRIPSCVIREDKSSQQLTLDFGRLDYFIVLIDKDRERPISGVAADRLLPFLNPTVSDITKKNDAIVLVCDGSKLYAFMIEMKTSDKGDYLRQIQAGKCFLEFVVALLKLHEKLDTKLVVNYYGLLCRSRTAPNKGTTKHSEIKFEPKSGVLIHECNTDQLNMRSLIDAAKRKEAES